MKLKRFWEGSMIELKILFTFNSIPIFITSFNIDLDSNYGGLNFYNSFPLEIEGF